MPNQQKPLISICIPTYKRPEYLRQSLRSALDQTYDNFEVLISDDTPDDSIQSLVESTRPMRPIKISYTRNAPPLGLNRKLNYFLDHARGDWMLILCDDDLLDKDYLKTLVPYISQYPDATLIRCRYRLIDAEGRLIRYDRWNKLRMTALEFINEIFLPDQQSFKMNISGIMFPRKLLKELGGFRIFHKVFHVDRLAWALLSACGISLCEKKPLCSVRLHAESITSSFDPDYEASIGATLAMKADVEKILLELEAKATSTSDHELAAKTRASFTQYVERHMQRAFDQALICSLESHDSHHEDAKVIFKKLRDVNLPFFPSARLYSVLSYVPLILRRPLIHAIKTYKVRKWSV